MASNVGRSNPHNTTLMDRDGWRRYLSAAGCLLLLSWLQHGDAVLVGFCQLATSLLRPNDLFGRVGGEEFVSLLPKITRKDALLLAERLRAAFE
jgi:hypothetical protein